jgi:ADP-ribose pyrophosphatase
VPASRRLRHRTVYKGRVFTVDRDDVRLPNGRVVAMDIVRHRGSVVLVPQPDPDHVILIRQFRYVIGRWIWELPAGSLDPGEAPGKAARRECAEEIGWTPRRIRKLARFYPTPGFCDELMTFYHCTDLVKPRGHVALDPDEQIEPRVFTMSEASRMVASGDVIDMKTVLGLQLVSLAGRE